jgi:FtsH-binding integral membrane protein
MNLTEAVVVFLVAALGAFSGKFLYEFISENSASRFQEAIAIGLVTVVLAMILNLLFGVRPNK